MISCHTTALKCKTSHLFQKAIKLDSTRLASPINLATRKQKKKAKRLALPFFFSIEMHLHLHLLTHT